MSGIGGIVYFDGRPVTPDALGRFIDVCAHRGPHGRGTWADGSVGLAMRLLRPGAPAPSSPRQLDLCDDGLVVVADARIDNRHELMNALQLGTASTREASSRDLIRASYLRWGDRCTEHLLGDFAFAVWDARAKRLFCARDHFGVRPFYYGLTDRALVFASEMKAILALGEVRRSVNEGRIAEYLASIVLDNTTTFYEGIARLPPGHSLGVDGATATVKRYWALGRVASPSVGAPDEHVEHFRETFYEAVRCRLPVGQPVGAMLSGGLDSSAIAAAMMDILPAEDPPRLHAFTAVFQTVTECDESEYADAVLANGRAITHSIQGDHFGPFSDLGAMVGQHDEPHGAPNLFMVWALYAQARASGIGTILDGYDGDTTLSHGVGYLHDMAIAGRWIALYTQLRGMAKIDGGSAWKTLWRFYNYHALRPFLARSPWNLPGRSYHRIRRSLLSAPAATDETGASEVVPYINVEFARRTNLDERYRRWLEVSPGRARGGLEQHYLGITDCLQPYALEAYDRTTAAFSIETAHPFWDKRLVELSLALPAELKLAGGRSRMVLRRAMRGALPEKVVWRDSKVDFFSNVRNAFVSVNKDQVEQLIFGRDLDVVADYVDLDQVREAHRRLKASEDTSWRQDLFAVWKAVSLTLWLRA